MMYPISVRTKWA